MKTTKNNFRSLLLLTLLGFVSCEKEEIPEPVILQEQSAVDIPADPNGGHGPSNNFTYFDLETGEVLQKSDSTSTKWDLAFAGTTILVNGGASGPGQGSAQVIDGIFEDIDSAPESGYAVDSEESLAIPSGNGTGWYTYTGREGTPNFAVLPIPGKVIMLTTGEGNYAKVEIISYYKGNPDTSTAEFADLDSRPASRYYTFRYVVQKNGQNDF